jgi:predicted RNA-binding Zn ribbon-like protein
MRQPGDRPAAPPDLALVQDLLNTIDIEMGQDGLEGPSDLERFCRAHGLTRLKFRRDDVALVRRFREALRDVCATHAGHDVPAGSLRTVTRHFGEAPVMMVVSNSGQTAVAPARHLRSVDALVAHVAACIATAPPEHWHRLKVCSADACRWAYYDRSPTGRSKWCTMRLCGSRAKMRTYRQRDRAQAQGR